MRRVFLLAGGALLLLTAGLALLATRPWSEYSPLRMNRIFHPEERVENFRRMDRIFPFRSIARSAAPQPLARTSAAIAETYEFGGERRSLPGFLERTYNTGLIVLYEGKIVHESYRRGTTADSKLTSWSVAKSVVATLVGIALAEGSIRSLDDRADAYVRELEGSAYGRATVRDLLRMASGVKFDETYADRLSDINMLFYKVFIFGVPVNSAVASHAEEAPPGTRFRYVSADTQVLASILREATGMPLAKYAETRLWQPLGMESDAFWNVDAPGGAELGYCCLNATLRDFAKIGQLYLQRGRWNGRQVLPEHWIALATRPGAEWQEPVNTKDKFRGYAFQWWVPQGYDGEYYASGVWGQQIWVSEKDRVVVVRTSVDPQYRKHLEEANAVMRAISRGLSAGR